MDDSAVFMEFRTTFYEPIKGTEFKNIPGGLFNPGGGEGGGVGGGGEVGGVGRGGGGKVKFFISISKTHMLRI